MAFLHARARVYAYDGSEKAVRMGGSCLFIRLDSVAHMHVVAAAVFIGGICRRQSDRSMCTARVHLFHVRLSDGFERKSTRNVFHFDGALVILAGERDGMPYHGCKIKTKDEWNSPRRQVSRSLARWPLGEERVRR